MQIWEKLLLTKSDCNIRKTWSVIKESLIIAVNCKPAFLEKVVIDTVEIIVQRQITIEFNAFFKDIGPQMVSNPLRPFENVERKIDKTMSSIPLSINESKEAFFL